MRSSTTNQPPSRVERGNRLRIPPLLKTLIAIAIGLVVYLLLPADDAQLPAEARFTAAAGITMALLWMTEALPLAITALLPIALFPLAGIGSISEVTAPYASDVIFLFLGGFMLAAAMHQSQLHRRIALAIVDWVGVEPARLVGGFMIATAFLSMWISNTAATVMLLPIGASIVGLVSRPAGFAHPEEPPAEYMGRFATGLMLGIAYAASIGSLATPIGTPPNLFMIGFLERSYDRSIGFGQWMAFGLPIVLILLPICWYLLTGILYRPTFTTIPGGREIISSERARLGPMTRPEKVVASVFVSAVFAWVLREPLTGWDPLVDRLPWIERLTDPGIAIVAALALFAIPAESWLGQPVMTWEATRDIPWNILLLFGGGLSLAWAVTTSGLDTWIGERLSALTTLPVILIVAAITSVIILLTELTSNTATAATFLPILAGLAVTSDLDPLLLVVPAALAGTCAFMLPVATPPNAIVFGSGHVTIAQMARSGIILNVVAVAVIALAVMLLGPPILGIER